MYCATRHLSLLSELHGQQILLALTRIENTLADSISLYRQNNNNNQDSSEKIDQPFENVRKISINLGTKAHKTNIFQKKVILENSSEDTEVIIKHDGDTSINCDIEGKLTSYSGSNTPLFYSLISEKIGVFQKRTTITNCLTGEIIRVKLHGEIVKPVISISPHRIEDNILMNDSMQVESSFMIRNESAATFSVYIKFTPEENKSPESFFLIANNPLRLRSGEETRIKCNFTLSQKKNVIEGNFCISLSEKSPILSNVPISLRAITPQIKVRSGLLSTLINNKSYNLDFQSDSNICDFLTITNTCEVPFTLEPHSSEEIRFSDSSINILPAQSITLQCDIFLQDGLNDIKLQFIYASQYQFFVTIKVFRYSNLNISPKITFSGSWTNSIIQAKVSSLSYNNLLLEFPKRRNEDRIFEISSKLDLTISLKYPFAFLEEIQIQYKVNTTITTGILRISPSENDFRFGKKGQGLGFRDLI